jgi:hypothetical protein
VGCFREHLERLLVITVMGRAQSGRYALTHGVPNASSYFCVVLTRDIDI